MLIYPDFARGVLDIPGSLQAKDRDDYRDAEPGKILHEIRYGELAHFKLIPAHALETAGRCRSWIDNYGDRGSDGFQEYPEPFSCRL